MARQREAHQPPSRRTEGSLGVRRNFNGAVSHDVVNPTRRTWHTSPQGARGIERR